MHQHCSSSAPPAMASRRFPSLNRAREFQRLKRERESHRLQPQAREECTAAEARLGSRSPDERIQAASTLGRLRFADSYGTLLGALIAESAAGATENREVELALLKALEDVGSEHNAKSLITAGREPIKRFIMSHLADAQIVGAALEALSWTGPVNEISTDAMAIGVEAVRQGHTETRQAESSFFLRLTER